MLEVADPPAQPTPQASPPAQINVSQMPKPATTRPDPKPGTARDKLRQDLAKRAGIEPKQAAPKPEEPKQSEPKSDDKSPEKPAETVQDTPKPAETPKAEP